jgi:hypothetical protein
MTSRSLIASLLVGTSAMNTTAAMGVEANPKNFFISGGEGDSGRDQMRSIILFFEILLPPPPADTGARLCGPRWSRNRECLERQIYAPTRNFGLVLYKIFLKDRRRPNQDVQDFSLDGRNELKPDLPNQALISVDPRFPLLRNIDSHLQICLNLHNMQNVGITH